MRFIFRLLLLTTLLSLTACIPNYHIEEAFYNLCHGHYRDAFIHLRPAAAAGNPDAQYAVGFMYYYSLGVAEDRKQAYMWICKAAHAGHKEAIRAKKILDAQPRCIRKPLRLRVMKYSIR